MLYIFLSIFCSVIVYILLKLSKRYHIDVLQAVGWSISANIFLTWLVCKPVLPAQIFTTIPNYNYLALGFLLPVMLLLIKSSIQATGITLTVIAKRLSLFIPVIVSFFVGGIQPNKLQLVAVVLGLAAIICSIPWKKARGTKKSTGAWFYLIIIFTGIGISTVLFDRVALLSTPLPTSMFIIYILAFAVSVVFVIIQIFRNKTKFSIPHIIIGWILGVASFGSLFFNLKAREELNTRPAVFFLATNIGAITLGTLVGLLIFDEKLSKMNKIAIFFALVAIIIIAKA
jgi:hypothetical protein